MKLEKDMIKRNMKVVFKPMEQLISEFGFKRQYDGDFMKIVPKFEKHRELINSEMVWHMSGSHVCKITDIHISGIYDFRYEASKPDWRSESWCAMCSWVKDYSKDGVWYQNEEIPMDFEIEDLFLL